MDVIHEQYMRLCLKLAEKAFQSGNAPVGAIIVHDNQVIGEGIESGSSSGDITQHAEILAIQDAIKNQKKKLIPNAVMYTTHEPCIMCSYVIRHHKIPSVVYGISVDHIGGSTSKFKVLITEEIPQWGKPPSVTSDVCLQECLEITDRFRKNKLS